MHKGFIFLIVAEVLLVVAIVLLSWYLISNSPRKGSLKKMVNDLVDIVKGGSQKPVEKY
jgi:hypothetical protein